jgi:DNA-binding transcriptional MerR regulator
MKLTFKQVAEKAGVNPSTAAFQRNKFEEFIPSIGEGRHRRYNDESVEVIKITSTMYSQGKSYEEIKDFLENKYGVQVTDIAVKENNVATTQQDMLSAIKVMFNDEMKSRDKAIEVLVEKVDALAQGSQERDKLLMETLREIQSRDEKKKGLKWWRMLRGE